MVSDMTLPTEPGVTSREELARCIGRLGAEFQQRGYAWENPALDRYLDAPAACVRDHGRSAGPLPASGDAPAIWGFVAFVLGAATVYE